MKYTARTRDGSQWAVARDGRSSFGSNQGSTNSGWDGWMEMEKMEKLKEDTDQERDELRAPSSLRRAGSRLIVGRAT
jgi:hypothetical protein